MVAQDILSYQCLHFEHQLLQIVLSSLPGAGNITFRCILVTLLQI